MTTKKQRPYKLRRASAYYRLAAKEDRAGNTTQSAYYWNLAFRLVQENRREQEALKARRAADAAWKKRP